MKLRDINKWINPPPGYLLTRVDAEGNFLKLDYRQILYEAGTTRVKGRSVITIYANDNGREVLRTCDAEIDDPPEPVSHIPAKPLSAWERVALAFGFLIISLKEALCR